MAQQTTPDITIQNEGSIIMFRPMNKNAKEWMNENIEEGAQWFGGALAVEHRYATGLADGMRIHGFVLA